MATPKSFVPDTPSSFVADDSPAPDFTSNPKGEGLYRMGSYDFSGGNVSKPEIQVPYSRVKDAMAAGYKLHPDETQRYQKDASHEGQGPTLLERGKSMFQSATQPIPDNAVRPIDPNHPVVSALNRAGDVAENVYKMPLNFIKAVDRGVYEGLPQLPAQVWDTLKKINRGDPQGAEQLNSFLPPGMAANLMDGYLSDKRQYGDAAALSTLGGNLATLYAAGEIMPEVSGPVSRGLRSTAEKFREGTQSLVGAGRENIRGRVETEAESAGQNARTTEEKNRAAISKHDEDLREAGQKNVNAHVKYLADTAEANQSNAAAEAVPDARAALEGEITDKSGERQKLIDKAEADAKADLDKRYEDQRELLNDEKIPDTYKDGAIVKNALSSLNIGERTIDAYESLQTKPDPTLPPEMKELHSRAGEELGWRELQGIRSKLSSKLTSGSLNGEVYQGYKAALGVIDDGLQKIADNMGVGDQVRKNRADYAHFMQTFHDSISEPNTVARKTQTATSPDFVRSSEETQRRKDLDVYDKNIGQLGGEIDSLTGRLSSLPAESTRPKATPPAYPEEVTVEPPKTNRIEVPELNTREMREDLVKKWARGESGLNKFQVARLIGSAGLGTIIGTIFQSRGLGAEVGSAVGTAAYGLSPVLVAKIISHPGVMEFLSRPPADEVQALTEGPNAIPYSDRVRIIEGLKQIVPAARAKGIKISPIILSLVGMAAVAPQGPQTRKLQDTADEYRSTAQ